MTVWRLLRDHTEAVEADFSRFYSPRDDIRGIWTGALSWRRAYALMMQLPPESALRRELGGPIAQWTQSEHMLAAIVDALNVHNWMYGSVHRAENTPAPPRPTLMKRPGDPLDEEKKDSVSVSKFGTAEEQAQKLSKMLSGLGGG